MKLTPIDPIPKKLSTTRPIRIYSEDEELIIALHREVEKLQRKVTIVDLIRDCVQAGLPSVQKKWAPLIKHSGKSEDEN